MSELDEEMWKRVETSELPLVLTRLSDFTIQQATEAYLKEIPVPSKDLIGKSVFSLMDPVERPRAREALEALADGTIDFYRTYRPLSLEHTHRSGVYVWSHAIDFGTRRYALTQVRATEESSESPLTMSLGYEPTRFAIGIVDRRGVVTSVSNDVDDVIGVTAENLTGHSLLTREQWKLWIHFHSTKEEHHGCSMSMPFQSTAPRLADVSIQCLLVCLAGSDSFCFVLSQEPPLHEAEQSSRSAALEQHLVRIAQEVQASGVLGRLGRVPDPARFPQLRSLNSRQWDVLNRLLRGDRVAVIAHDLYLSPSAVRNRLSEVFRKFDVHSQSELLALLRS